MMAFKLSQKVVLIFICPDDYQQKEVAVTRPMANQPGKEDHGMKIHYIFITKMTRQTTMLSIREWPRPAENSGTD